MAAERFGQGVQMARETAEQGVQIENNRSYLSSYIQHKTRKL